MRPLPELTPANEWFWTSGADGCLRIQQCEDCGSLVHPPTPIWTSCRSRSWKPAAVSGRGAVVAFMVNAHRWLPGFGGQLSEGGTHGFGFIYETVVQLRQGAGDCQVGGATTAVVSTGGGTPSGVMLLQRDGC